MCINGTVTEMPDLIAMGIQLQINNSHRLTVNIFYGQLNPRDASVGTFWETSGYNEAIIIITIMTLHSKIHPADWWKALDKWPS